MKLKNIFKKRKKRQKLIKCYYEGCTKEFMGYPATKYCDFHRDIKNRKSVKKVKQFTDFNLMVKHQHLEPVETDLKCELKGCKQKYKVILLPKLFIYPKYCEAHRNEFKRKSFLEAQTCSK
jgi:hypothetical protein